MLKACKIELNRTVVLPMLLALTACGGGDSTTAPTPIVPIPTPTYAVGGNVAGLTGTVVLQLNSANDLSVAVSGPVTFAIALSSGTAYSVTVKTQPSAPNQTCSVANGSGTVASSNVTNVAISCVSGANQHLYVAAQLNNAVFVYDIAADGTLSGPSRTLTGAATQLDRPTSVGVDDQGRLYVANLGAFPAVGGNVTVYAAGATGNTAPINTLLNGRNPYYVSFRAQSFIAYQRRLDFSQVTIFDPTIFENSLLTSTIVLAPFTGIPGSDVFPPYVVPNATSWASYRALPSTNGFLCAGSKSATSNGSIRCITQPVLVITGTPPAGSTPQILNGQAVDVFGFAAADPADVKFMENGQLVVSNRRIFGRAPSVDTYDVPGFQSTGFTQAIRTVASIAGELTRLTTPTSIAFDASGNMYVGDTGNGSSQGSVHVFAPGATGNVPPVRALTGLNFPFGIAIGR